jgi:hypothetical protein
MITVSDNDAASALWAELGGGGAVEAYLSSIGIDAIHPDSGGAWGDSTTSAKGVALLLAQLAWGGILDENSRTLALDLMGRVVPAQGWGVTAGIPGPDLRPSGSLMGIKDGWYPAPEGWWLNSVGVILPAGAKPAYVIAVLTAGQSSMAYGIGTIEAVGELVHAQIHGVAKSK